MKEMSFIVDDLGKKHSWNKMLDRIDEPRKMEAFI